LASGEKLLISIGGINLSPKSKAKLPDTSLQEQELQSSSDGADDLQECRGKLIEALNKRNEVKEILDYYDSSDKYSGMNPVLFIFHLPLSLQALQSKAMMDSNSEDFFCLVSDKLLLIGTVCSIEEYPLYYDIRNKIIEMIKEIMAVEEIPPCLSFGGMLYTKEAAKIDNVTGFNCSVKQSDETIYDNLYDFYLDNFLEFECFYKASKI
jgi:hypothetical protein